MFIPGSQGYYQTSEYQSRENYPRVAPLHMNVDPKEKEAEDSSSIGIMGGRPDHRFDAELPVETVKWTQQQKLDRYSMSQAGPSHMVSESSSPHIQHVDSGMRDLANTRKGTELPPVYTFS